MKLNKIIISILIGYTITSAPIFSETYNDAPPSHYYTQGQSLYQTGQFSSAIKSFRKALRENPNDSSAKIGLINSYVSRAEYYNNTIKNPQKALLDLKSALFYFVCFNGNSAKTNYSQAYSAALTNLNSLEQNLKSDISGTGLINSARKQRIQGEFAAAGYDFYRALEDTNNSKNANIGLGDILKILGLPQASLPYYEIALKSDPNNPSLRLKLARAYEDSNQFGLAAEHYNYALTNSQEKEEILNSLERICRQRVEKNPADAEAHCNLGTIYQKRGNIEGALIEYQKADKLNPSIVTTKVNTAILYFEQKKYKEAIEASNKAILIEPHNTQARLQKAKSFQALSMWEQATEEYKNVLKYDEKNSEAQFGLAEIYSKNMPTEDALSTLKAQGVTLSPEFYSQTAYSAHKNKDIEKAIKYYKLAIEANPNDKSLYLNLGQIYNGRNDFNNALAYAQLAQQKFPNDKQVQDFYNSLKSRYTNSIYTEASKLAEQGKYTESLEKYKNISPQNYNSYVGIASVYQMMKDYNNAIIYYNKALEIKPNDENILIAISGLYLQQDDITNADKTISQIKNSSNPKVQEIKKYINSHNADSELNKAIAKYEEKDYQNAENILTTLINQKLGGYMTYYYRAMVYDAVGQYQQAINDYENVVAQNPSIPLVYYSLGVDYDSLKNFTKAVENYKKFIELSKEENEYTNYARERIKQSQ